MSRPLRQLDFEKETDNFEAFDHLTTALIHLDNYRSSKDEKQLSAAQNSLDEALKADDKYFKAKYFRAVVNSLIGKHKDAIGEFSELLERESASDTAHEIHYNMGVARLELNDFWGAIERFNKVIKAAANAETKLLAHAALALTTANRIEYLRKNNELSESTEKEDLAEIEKQDHEIKRILENTDRRRVSDAVVQEVKQIMEQALKKDLKLPKRRSRKRARALLRLKRIIAIGGVLIILWLLFLYVYLFVGLNNVFN
jgi:tetratricopeptide (TPR) repeat protein